MVEEVGVDGEGEDEGTWPAHTYTPTSSSFKLGT
jgi:hypothetical protein